MGNAKIIYLYRIQNLKFDLLSRVIILGSLAEVCVAVDGGVVIGGDGGDGDCTDA